MHIRRPNSRSTGLRALAFFGAALAFLVLSPITARAAEPPPLPTQQQQQPPTPAPQAENAPAPKARREDIEPATLAEAKGLLTSSRADRDKAEADFQAEATAHLKTQGILKSTTETCQHAQAENQRLTGELATATKSFESEKTAHSKTSNLLSLAEGALGVKGIPAASAAPAIDQPKATQTVAQWDAKIAAEKDPAKRQQLTAEFEKAYAAGEVV